MWVTIRPISSMWLISSSRLGAFSKPCFAETRASGVPITSVLTSANALAASRQTSAGAVS